MNDLIEKARKILHSPVHGGFCGNPHPMSLRPDILAGKAQVGDTLMQEVGRTHHTKDMIVLCGDDISSKPDYTFRSDYIGFWRMSARCTLFFHNDFRQEFPVWSFSILGGFCERVVQAQDTSIPNMLLDTLIESGRQVFAMRRAGDNTFHPRAPSYKQEDVVYISSLEGDWQSCTGSEELIYKGESVWQAYYAGTIITSKNAPP